MTIGMNSVEQIDDNLKLFKVYVLVSYSTKFAIRSFSLGFS